MLHVACLVLLIKALARIYSHALLFWTLKVTSTAYSKSCPKIEALVLGLHPQWPDGRLRRLPPFVRKS